MAWTRSPSIPQEVGHLGEVEGGALGQCHHRTGSLARLRVGQPDHGHVGDGRVGVEEVLDLLGRDVLAMADDHVLQPAGDGHVTLGVDHPEVAAAEVALCVEGIGVEGRVEVASR